MAGDARIRTYVVMAFVMAVVVFAAVALAAKSFARRTVAEVIEHYGPEADAAWRRRAADADLSWPLATVTLVFLKEEKTLEIWGHDAKGGMARLVTYPVLGASGGPGPKLREGDKQVPEGVYGVEGLNPNSRFHLSIKIDYPNTADQRQAYIDGRDKLGGDIFIHGGSASAGCIAIGNSAIEELFVLVAGLDLAGIKVLLCPNDLRSAPPVTPNPPLWLRDRYDQLHRELMQLEGYEDNAIDLW